MKRQCNVSRFLCVHVAIISIKRVKALYLNSFFTFYANESISRLKRLPFRPDITRLKNGKRVLLQSLNRIP